MKLDLTEAEAKALDAALEDIIDIYATDEDPQARADAKVLEAIHDRLGTLRMGEATADRDTEVRLEAAHYDLGHEL